MSTTPTERATHTSSYYQKAIGVLIWLTFAAVGLGVLYLISILMGDPPTP